MNSASSQNLVKTELDNLVADTGSWTIRPEEGSVLDGRIFQQIRPETGAYAEAPMGGGGYFGKTGEQQSPDLKHRKSGDTVTYVMNDYTQAELLPQNFERDSSKLRAAAKVIMSMKASAKASMELYGMEVLRAGFTTAKTYDGVSLFNDAHTLLDGSSLDNLVTGALDDAALNDAFVRMKKMKNQDGQTGRYVPTCLLVPSELMKTAVEITQSELRSGTANNDVNYFSKLYPGLMVKESPFLSTGIDTGLGLTEGSASKWFLISQDTPLLNIMEEGYQMEIVDAGSRDDFQSLAKAKFRQAVGATIPNGIVGANATT